MTTLSSREFSQRVSQAKKEAGNGPVFITARGRPAHVLLSIEDYQRLTAGGRSLLDAVTAWSGGDFEFDPPRLGEGRLRPTDLG